MQTPLPASTSGPLIVYQAQDGSIWVANPASGFGTMLVPTGGYTAAPPPSGGITTETDPLSVHTSGGTMTGPLAITDGTATVTLRTIPASQANPAGGTGLQISDGTHTAQIGIWNTGIAPAGTGVLCMPGQSVQVGVTSTPNVQIYQDRVEIVSSNNIHVQLAVNTNGDLVATTSSGGANAGKAVNLTTGKWA